MIGPYIQNRFAYLKRIFCSYLLHYNTSNFAFWHTSQKLNNLPDGDLKTVSVYPQNFESKIGRIQTSDKFGVILLDYKGNLGLQYNPNAIAQLALAYYDKILSGQDFLNDFFIQAAYFLNHGRIIEDNILLWEYNFPFEMRNFLEAPWRSALAQGQGISVCLRAYNLSGDARYLNAAQKAFNAFRHLAREHPGGVIDDSNGYVWLEEYIVTPPNHVLNGFIWSLWGVRDYAVFFNDKYAWELWNSCLKTLHDNLTHYDLGFWTTYDLVKFYYGNYPTMPSSLYYQDLHSVQMKAMYNLTGDSLFDYYANRWSSQLSNPLYKTISQIWKVYFKLRWF